MEKILTKRNILLTIVLFVFSVSLSTFFIKIIPPLPVISDSKDYHDIAVGIVSKLDYVTISSDLILYPPFYPVFLSIIYTITDVGSFAAVYLIQYILVFGISVLVFKILRKYSQMSFKLTLSMSCVILFWPYFILYSQLISSEILYSFLLLFSFFLFLNIDNYSKKWLTFCTGIFIGLTILTRPVALLLLPWVFLGLVLIGRMPRIFGQFSIPWKKYLLTLIIAIAVLLPWELYVKVRYDRFIPVASNLSFVFNKANRTLTYLQENKIVPEENKSSNLLKAKLKNIYLFWNPGASGYHLDILKKEYPLSSYAVLLYKILFFTVLGLAGIAAILSYKNRIIILSILVISYFWAVHTVLFPFPRYTLPIIPFVIILAGMGINCLSEFLYARK